MYVCTNAGRYKEHHLFQPQHAQLHQPQCGSEGPLATCWPRHLLWNVRIISVHYCTGTLSNHNVTSICDVVNLALLTIRKCWQSSPSMHKDVITWTVIPILAQQDCIVAFLQNWILFVLGVCLPYIVINPRLRACAARVITVRLSVCVCVCVCVRVSVRPSTVFLGNHGNSEHETWT